MQKVLHCGALSQKLRIGDDIECIPWNSIALDHSTNPFVGVYRDGALFDDDLVPFDGAGDFAGDCLYIGQISISGLRLGRSNRDKYGLTGARRLTQIGHKPYTGVAISLQKFRQVVLMNERVTALERGYLAFVVIHADDGMTHLSKTHRGDQPDIS